MLLRQCVIPPSIYNSRGNVVSSSDVATSADTVELPPTVAEEIPAASEITGSTLTPPEVFTTPGRTTMEFDMDEIPKPSSAQFDSMDEGPTPRAPSSASNRADYMDISK
ncbi:hypothetical protein DL95DRAFT_463307 [Leptodontidium sp. 2 PMI_412]|nr:hypothetical protein DL95DRAFT_463307 [Leptodontidium sp. 2 PMI_412]